MLKSFTYIEPKLNCSVSNIEEIGTLSFCARSRSISIYNCGEETLNVVKALKIGAVLRARSAIILVYFSISRMPRPTLS